MPVDLKTLSPKLVNLLLDTVVALDESGKIVFINEACAQLLGYTADEMMGTQLMSYIHPDDLDQTLEVAGRVMSGESHTHFENRYLHRDGSVVHILWSARWSAEDRLRIGVARNITALRHSDQTRNALYRISEVAHAADTLRTLCDGVREVINELWPDNILHLAFHDAATGMLNAPDWPSDGSSDWVQTPIEAGSALADVILSGRPLLAYRDQEHQEMGPGDHQADWLGVPLTDGDTVLGALVVEGASKDACFRDSDRELLQFVATQVATMVVRKQAEEKLRFLAHHDPLTGLTNRSLFYDRLEMALRSASRNNQRLALLYLDLNDFKRINDTWGHEAGDRVIMEMARRLEEATRKTDTVGRMGGDEFTVLLTDIEEPSSVDTAVGKIHRTMATPMDFADEAFYVTCSIGVALYPEDGMTTRQLLNKADAAMYGNKHGA